MSLTTLVTGFALLVTTYFAVSNIMELVIGTAAARFLWRYQHRRTPRSRALAGRLASAPLVSVIVPACNEALTVVESVRALLALDYEAREIVIVNDGSTDDTLDVLRAAFHLVAAPVAFAQPIRTAPLRGVYRSVDDPGLLVVDKENGGCKADASNAGINAASGALVLVIDADTVLEPDALSRAVLPLLEDPDVVAVGAYVAIANGCRIEHGKVVDLTMPRSWLARFQVIEYMRSFLLFRIACASRNGVTIISGAFGLFRRDAAIAVGGFDPTAIGEDMDLTLRLQRLYRSRGKPFHIGFVPLPLCWTQAPEDLASLRAQRCRWRRGLLQVLWRHRRAIGNPRYGLVGLGVLPYTTFIEGFGPVLEISGYVITTAAACLGFLEWYHYKVLLAASVLFGASSTLLAVLLSDATTRRYHRSRDLALLIIVALLENVGYRQLNSWWGFVGTVQALTGTGKGWGKMRRRAF